MQIIILQLMTRYFHLRLRDPITDISLFSTYDVRRSFIWNYYRLGARAGELHPLAFDKAIASNLSQMLPY